jgi:hypothetical protein
MPLTIWLCRMEYMDVAQATSFALPACRPSTGQIANNLPRLINLVSARRQRSPAEETLVGDFQKGQRPRR